MRFSRRNKGPLAWARRSKSRTQDPEAEQEFGPVASEERSALLSPQGASEGSRNDAPGDDLDHEEATQHMLSALGRFHRQVTKAKVGAAQELWTDECMNELVTAAEVAVREGWRETVAVLTETGRILQTYEDAGRAGECVQFLSEAYDILSLMVGDLIVGEVRPGVMQKWGECHAKALHMLDAAGLSLIDVEEEGEERAEYVRTGQEPIRPLNTVPFELPPLDDYDPDAEHDDDSGEVPTLDNLEPMEEVEAARTEPIDEDLLAAEQQREQNLVIETTSDEDPLDAAVASLTGGGDAPIFSEMTLTPLDDEEALDEEAADDVAEEAAGEPAAGESENAEVVATFDSFCEGLRRIEDNGDRDLTTVYAAMLDELIFLDKLAVEAGYEHAQQVTRNMARLCQHVAEGNAAPNEKFIELGYGFCEAYVQAQSPDVTPSVKNWLHECKVLHQQWTDAASQAGASAVEESPVDTAVEEEARESEALAEAAPPAAAPLENDGSPEALLRIAQEAVVNGRVTEAKVFAMQAAAAFAQREADQAQHRLQDIEGRINEGGTQIETARGELREAEEAVVEAEKQTKSGEESLQECGGHTQEAQQHLETVEAEIADLDERIRELQAQRDAAAERRTEADEELGRKRTEESEAESTLDTRRQEEDEARSRLEEARQKVKNLERKRSELELEMERARDVLARQQSSLEDIQQTIAQLKSSDLAGGGESSELLF